jgi:integrase
MMIPEPRFYLKQPQSLQPTLISMQAKYMGQRVFMSTGDKVPPVDWDFEKQRVKINRKNLSSSETNMWLDKMAAEFKSIFRNCLLDEVVPTEDVILKKLQERLNLKYQPPVIIVESKLSFYKFIEQYIIECKGLKSDATIKTYGTTLKHLKKYSIVSCKEFDFEDITIEWRAGFIRYLQSLGVARNTEGKNIKNVKVFLNEATERGINNNLAFRSRSFSKPTEDVHKIFLTREDIQRLVDYDFAADKSKELVRDYFVISCMTSLRYSDFVDIKPENIKDNTIEIVTKKTGEAVIIPIARMVRDIFEKYNYNMPKAPCNQVFNVILKDVGRLAGLTDTVTITKTIGGVKKTIVYERYQLLTCHTGRRSMISNSILAGMPTSSIMLISAHKSLKVFQGYVRIDQKQNADNLASHSFFN